MDDDLFGDVVDLEQQLIKEGHDKGVIDGRKIGLCEGQELGVQKGFEVGLEVGYVQGCVRAYRWLQERHPGCLPERCDRLLAAVEALLEQIPLDDPQNERLQELMSQLQAKFKAAVATLGVQDALLAEAPATAAADTSF